MVIPASAESYSILLEDKICTIFIVGLNEDYKDRHIAIIAFHDQHDFNLVVKHIKKEMNLDLERLKFQLIFQCGESN